MDRRTWLKLAAYVSAAAAFSPSSFAQAAPDASVPFSEDQLDATARDLASRPYKEPEKHLDETLANISYDQYRDSISFKEKKSLWSEDNLAFHIDLLQAAGSFYSFPVEIFTVEAGRATKIVYSPEYFTFKPPLATPPLNSQSGFAGFRARAQINDPAHFDEFLVFLGASYFRSMASGQVFGLQARGLAINTGQAGGEEFPIFRSFWIERPKPGEQRLVIYALLDSASTVGRYKFIAKPGADTTVEVETVIYPRKRIPYAGIAPITSMFFLGPDAPSKRRDYRPRVHDSEALSILNGAGERIWRPLINPERLQFSVFVDKNPKGFGLFQRARAFAEYQDLKEQYEKRPSLWIEPIGEWGEGSIDLIELPAPEDPRDNIVCFWRPKDGLGPGIGHRFNYRMHWFWDAPVKTDEAAIAQTRLGETRAGDALFIVDFATDKCELCNTGMLEANVSASAGEIRGVTLTRNPGSGGHRLKFEYIPSGGQPTDLRANLTLGGKSVTESWIFRWAR